MDKQNHGRERMTFQDFGWCAAACVAIYYLTRRILQIGENTALIDDQEQRISALEKANLEREDEDRERQSMGEKIQERLHGCFEAMTLIGRFQAEVTEMVRGDGGEPLEVRDCRRCGRTPLSNEHTNTLYNGGYFRLQCRCHPTHTSQWYKSARDVMLSWNQMQAVWEGEMEKLQDIYQEMATEHPPLNECACCGEDCWAIEVATPEANDPIGEKFRIYNGCEAVQQHRGYHRTTDAAVKQWNELQDEIAKAIH